MLLFTFFFNLSQRSKLLVPLGLQCVRDEPIVRIHPHVADSGLVRFILSSLQLLLPETIGFLHSRLDFALNIQGHFERQRSDALH